jgi:hypothetical protein
VTNRRWALRIQAYIAYRLGGRFQARYGVLSFRVLTVTTTGRRLANLLATTRRAGGGGIFWFTTFDLLTSQLPLSPIWSAAGAGRIGVAGSVVSSKSDAPDSVLCGDDRPSLSGQRGGRQTRWLQVRILWSTTAASRAYHALEAAMTVSLIPILSPAGGRPSAAKSTVGVPSTMSRTAMW